MKRVWKWKLKDTESTEVDLPLGAEVLCVATQDNWPCLWALIDEENLSTSVRRTFHIAGTGHPVDDGWTYLGTCQTSGGLFVWHIFEANA